MNWNGCVQNLVKAAAGVVGWAEAPGFAAKAAIIVAQGLARTPRALAIANRRVSEPAYSAALAGRFQCLPNRGLKPWAIIYSRFAAESRFPCRLTHCHCPWEEQVEQNSDQYEVK
jgi:hypothetical protein